MIVNIRTFSDADFYREFIYKTAGESPAAISLAGMNMEMMVRRTAASASVLVYASMGNGLIVPDYNVTGWFSVRLPWSELKLLAEGQYDHSLVATLGSKRTQIWRGTLIHKAGATR